MAKNSCYGCTERTVGCHSTCKKYQAFVTENEARKARMKEERRIENAISTIRSRCNKNA